MFCPGRLSGALWPVGRPTFHRSLTPICLALRASGTNNAKLPFVGLGREERASVWPDPTVAERQQLRVPALALPSPAGGGVG